MFCPPAAEMYGKRHSTVVEETSLSAHLCGASRPAHFRGVATVVVKLLNLVQPHTAVFGRKDAQQARIIERVVADLNIPTEIVVSPIVREDDGLAMSSRNAYLSAEERRRALCLYRALCRAESLYAGGARDAASVLAQMRELIEEGDPPVSIDYIEAVDYETLEPVARLDGPAIVAVAVRVGRTRLIDNVLLGPNGTPRR
jgi:pantoate--beta-alanine ligase